MTNDEDFDFWDFWDAVDEENYEENYHDKEKILYQKHRRNRVKAHIRMSSYQKIRYTNGHYSVISKNHWEIERLKGRKNRKVRHSMIYFYGEKKESEKVSPRGNVLLEL